jgi:hypothetical protein
VGAGEDSPPEQLLLPLAEQLSLTREQLEEGSRIIHRTATTARYYQDSERLCVGTG